MCPGRGPRFGAGAVAGSAAVDCAHFRFLREVSDGRSASEPRCPGCRSRGGRGKRGTVTKAGPSRPARPPCRRRTSRASSRLGRETGGTGATLPGALLVLAVGGLGTPSAFSRSAVDAKAVSVAFDPAGEPGRDLLDQPRIAVGIGEVHERSVAGAFGVRAGLPRLDRERWAVPDVTHVNPTADEFVMLPLRCRRRSARLRPSRARRS